LGQHVMYLYCMDWCL